MPKLTTLNFHYCCAAQILHSSIYGNIQTQKQLINYLQKAKEDGYGIIVAIFTDKQKAEIDLMRSCFFHEERPVQKKRHPENKIILFYYLLDELEEDLKTLK